MNVQSPNSVIIAGKTHAVPNLSEVLVRAFAVGGATLSSAAGEKPESAVIPVVQDIRTASELREFVRRHEWKPESKGIAAGGTPAVKFRKLLKVLGAGAGAGLEWKGSSLAWQGFQLSHTATAADVNAQLLQCGVAPNYAGSLTTPILDVLKSTPFKALCVAVAGGGLTLMILDTVAIKKHSARRRRILLAMAIGCCFALVYLVLKAFHVLS